MNEQHPETITFEKRPRRAWVFVALGLILCVAAGLRFPNLENVPPGLWFDEALNGQDAWAVWQPGGHFKLVYPDEFPREPMYETALALVVKAAGPSVVAMRALSATIGTLTVLLLFLFLWRRGGCRGDAAVWALAAAGVLATMRWHVIFSRLVFRTLILGPWMLGLVWAALAYRAADAERGWKKARRAAVLGIFVGGGFYTYLGWYFLLPVVGGILVWLFARELCGKRNEIGRKGIHVAEAGEDLTAKTPRPPRESRKEGEEERGDKSLSKRKIDNSFPNWAGPVIVLAVAGLVFSPLGIHYLYHKEDLLARPGAVSVFSTGSRSAIREIAKNARDAALMFHWRGDHVPKQNIPWKAGLDLLQGIAFVFGILLCGGAAIRNLKKLLIRKSNMRKSEYENDQDYEHDYDDEHEHEHEKGCDALPVILLAWIGCGMAATVFTKTDSPNFLRTLCITPAVAMVTGLGLACAGAWLGRRLGRAACAALVAGALVVSAGWTARDVYAVWPARQDVWQSFNGDISDLARFAARAPREVAVYVPQFLWEHRSFRFQTLRRDNIFPYADWSMLAAWPPSARERGRPEPRKRWIIVTANNGLLEPLSGMVTGGGVVHAFKTPAGNTWAVVYSVPENSLPPPEALEKMQSQWLREMRY